MKRSEDALIRQARKIASQEIRSCITRQGILAGAHHFVDFWARDSLFAVFGANRIGLGEASRNTINTFLSYKLWDGRIPFLIRRSRLTPGKYFGHNSYHETPVPQFRSSQSGGFVPDGGLMTIIAARDYLERCGKKTLAREWYPYLKSAISWYIGTFGNGLIREWFQCEWADAVMKRGSTLYTNILYWKALQDMAWISGAARNAKDASTYRSYRDTIAGLVRKELWNGTYFADWKSLFRHDYFASHPNMLAIAFGFSTKEESRSILMYARKVCVDGWAVETNYPRYPFWRIPLVNYVTGTHDYHNRGCLWLQPALTYILALYRFGDKKQAKERLASLAQKIVLDGGIYEVYEKNGSPVRRLLYRAEYPFAWSSGLFLWVADTVY